jgi:release factor H-coupled RctB family protein
MPHLTPSDADVPVSVIATDRTWIEGDAVAQLRRVAGLPGMVRAVGLPDLHPGAGAPIGLALLSRHVWPHLVGSDIGCGVAVWVLRPKRRLNADTIGRRLTGLDRVKDGELDADWAARFDAPSHDALGTIGAGNHFLEIGAVDEVFDAATADEAGLTAGALVMLVHTGSRGLGRDILAAYTADHGADPCPDHLVEGYLAQHDAATRFAVANRAAVATRAADRLGIGIDAHRPLIDLCHNAVVRAPGGWLHRKGAAPNDGGLIALPGSRGARSHVVASGQDIGARAEALWSVAHGAGRKFSRSAARDRFGDVPRNDLRRTRWGSTVICTDPELLAEEAPGAYKDIEDVVHALVDAALVTPVAASAPVATYKTERGGAGPATREQRRRDRAASRERNARAAGRRTR